VVRDKSQKVIRSTNSLVTSSKKRKDLRALSEVAGLGTLKKSGNNNQEKQVMRQQTKQKPTVLIVTAFFVLIVSTRSIKLFNE
jgi:hypothetical protein